MPITFGLRHLIDPYMDERGQSAYRRSPRSSGMTPDELAAFVGGRLRNTKTDLRPDIAPWERLAKLVNDQLVSGQPHGGTLADALRDIFGGGGAVPPPMQPVPPAQGQQPGPGAPYASRPVGGFPRATSLFPRVPAQGPPAQPEAFGRFSPFEVMPGPQEQFPPPQVAAQGQPAPFQDELARIRAEQREILNQQVRAGLDPGRIDPRYATRGGVFADIPRVQPQQLSPMQPGGARGGGAVNDVQAQMNLIAGGQPPLEGYATRRARTAEEFADSRQNALLRFNEQGDLEGLGARDPQLMPGGAWESLGANVAAAQATGVPSQTAYQDWIRRNPTAPGTLNIYVPPVGREPAPVPSRGPLRMRGSEIIEGPPEMMTPTPTIAPSSQGTYTYAPPTPTGGGFDFRRPTGMIGEIPREPIPPMALEGGAPFREAGPASPQPETYRDVVRRQAEERYNRPWGSPVPEEAPGLAVASGKSGQGVFVTPKETRHQELRKERLGTPKRRAEAFKARPPGTTYRSRRAAGAQQPIPGADTAVTNSIVNRAVQDQPAAAPATTDQEASSLKRLQDAAKAGNRFIQNFLRSQGMSW